MIKVALMMLLGGILIEFIRGTHKSSNAGFRFLCFLTNSFLMSYILFLADISLIYFWFGKYYTEIIELVVERNDTIQYFFEIAGVWVVQIFLALLIAYVLRILKFRSVERAFFHMSLFQKRWIRAMVYIPVSILLVLFTLKDNAENRLVINEICSRNDSIAKDGYGEYSDYIEIYNPSGWDISLKDFWLSDNAGELEKMKLEDIVVPAEGYGLIWLNDTSVSLSGKGESVYLSSSSGRMIDSVSFPQLEADTVYARQSDGADEWEIQVPSPMYENDTRKKKLNDPVFSAESGFYENEFVLYIKAEAGETIYYTLDGSSPTTDSVCYTDGIVVYDPSDNPNVYRSIQNIVRDWKEYTPTEEAVDKAFIIRAIAVDEYGNSSDVVTKTYFVDMEKYQNSYVLSIVSEPEDMFGPNGIYTTGWEYDEWYLGGQEGEMPRCNFRFRGKEYEIETTLALFHEELLMEQDAGIRIQGASSSYEPDKRFSFFARKEYSGSRYFKYELFGQPMHSFFTRHDFSDMFVQSLVADRKAGSLKGVSAYVFVNGEFWYTTYLREKYSEDYLSVAYEVEKDTVCLEDVVPEEIYMFLAGKDLSDPESYNEFCDFIDVQSYIDYLACNIYLCNMDTSERKNVKVWKSTSDAGNGYSDGRWRWLLYDLDCLTWIDTEYYGCEAYAVDSFSQIKKFIGQAYDEETVYVALKENEDFCRQFVLTFMDLANYNFSPDIVESQMELWGENLEWNNGFFRYRYDYIVPALAEEFGLSGSLEELTVGINEEGAGSVRVNTIEPDLRENSWTGKYYTDYPVEITAIANEGYEFVGWLRENDVTETALIQEERLMVDLEEGGCAWRAVFQKITE